MNLVISFDGGCHHNLTPWEPAHIITGPPVQGLFEFIRAASKNLNVYIYSPEAECEKVEGAIQAWFAAWHVLWEKRVLTADPLPVRIRSKLPDYTIFFTYVESYDEVLNRSIRTAR